MKAKVNYLISRYLAEVVAFLFAIDIGCNKAEATNTSFIVIQSKPNVWKVFLY